MRKKKIILCCVASDKKAFKHLAMLFCHQRTILVSIHEETDHQATL